MYLILNSKNLIVDISNYGDYAVTQSNGVTITCDKEIATMIYSAHTDQFYPLQSQIIGGEHYSLIEVENVPKKVICGCCYYRNGEYICTLGDHELYEAITAQYIHEQYAIDKEQAITRKAIAYPVDEAVQAEFVAYNAYAEESKARARGEVFGVKESEAINE